MPIYEYKCLSCGKVYEKRQSVSDEPLTTCEKCHGKLEKQWSLSGFQFKGAGWYVTDYAGKSAGGGKKSDGGESTSTPETASKPSGEKTTTAKEPKPSASKE